MKFTPTRPVLAIVICVLAGVAVAAENDTPENIVRMSLIGTTLREPDWSPETKARLEKDLEIAHAVMSVAPERENSYIRLGRRVGYLVR